MPLTQERLEEIFQRPFKDEGDNWSALCPVHKERKPSFYVHKEKYLVNCFGCRLKGTLVKLIEEYKGVDESTALKMLGLTIEDLFDSMVGPGFTKDTVYPDSWLAPFEKGIHKYVSGRGFTESTLRKAEVCYDRNRKRQVFPHRRRDGKLVGAIGRACRGQEPRWHYYWNYQKGRHLYRAEVIPNGGTSDPTWIVEGVFDALWIYQHGYSAVALLGSKATDYQIEEIKDRYHSVVVALDNDEAGLSGSRDLYTKLKRHLKIVSPIWPRWGIDVMNTIPTELELVNLVQWTTLQASDRGSRVHTEQTKSSANPRTGIRKDSYSDRCLREA